METQSPMSNSQKIFSVRIVSIDYYMAPPIPGFDISYSSFQGAKVNEVPVIRVYGSTPAGQKTCLHVHKAFPYLYIPCSNLKLDAHQQGEAFANSVSLALEKALKLKGNAGSKRQHVHGCNLVRAKKFYGYHSSEELFVKIYLYYPQDVSRAANLLLGGAVLDRSFQPHESHIPFILQFLIDYNLYGMGHMHLSKMKFRHPIPIIPIMRKLSCGEHSGLGINKSSCTCDSVQTDTSAGECLDSPVWLSSTIPDGWMWHFAGDLGTSLLQEIQLVQRQSVCELEGDATVDEIMNQQFKNYTSLSQTCSDAKMVQSLIPIWEEEYERTGMHEPVIPPDLGKPLPHDVLKTLVNGLEFERNLRELCCRTHDKILPLSTDKGVLIDFEKELAASAADKKNVCAESSSPAGLESSENLGKSDLNAADTEALGILRWLAASQAGLDINSDDELVHETILSPLLPAMPIDKVLEKANMYYESESQKECQDILDSIQDVTDVEFVKEKSSPSVVHDHHSEILLEKQSSHASGLNSCCPRAGGLVKVENKGESYRYSEQMLQTAGKRLVNSHKRKKPSWGSLPFTLDQNVHPYSENVRSCPDDMSVAKPENCVVTVATVNDEEECSADTAKRGDTGVNESSTLVGCSIRDLMRKKRCHRASEVDNVFSSDKKSPTGEDSSLVPRRLDFYDSQSDKHEKKPISFLAHWPSDTKLPVDLRDDIGGSNFDLGVTESSKDKDSLSNEIERIGANRSNSSPASPIKQEIFAKEYSRRQFGSDGRISEGKLFAVHDENPCDMNQPAVTAFWNIENCYTSEHSEDDSVPVLCRPTHKMVSSGRPSIGDVKENEVMKLNAFPDDCNAQQEGVMDVSAHYQNDGSLLYLLTPYFSPPSAETVNRWLPRDCEDTPGGANLALSRLSSMEGSSEMGTGSASVDNNDVLIESRPMSPHKLILGQVQHDKGQGYSQEFQSHNNEDQSKQDIQENGVTLNDCSVYLSQISGPDGRSRPTPLSQIGFRDPASIGAGQQLTLLSVEVLAETRGDLRPDPRFDPINLITLAFQCDNDSAVQAFVLLRSKMDSSKKNYDGVSGCKFFVESEEKSLFARFVRIIASFDPDMLLGWDVQGGSLGFLAERAAHLGLGLLRDISRTPLGTNIGSGETEAFDEGDTESGPRELLVSSSPAVDDAVIQDEWGRTHASGVHVGGRVVLNVWRLMRGEVKLNMYTIEAVGEAVLRKKIPLIPHKVLTRWFASGTARARYRCIEYMIQRAKLNLEIMNQLDMVNRTSELARVFGIDFFSVLSRGSQYRVESMLLRLAHTQNYLAISPGSQQVASQPAMECLPLVMEPESGFYADPVVVLDFQSLYPSMIIAYNLCFSTCLGNVVPAKADTLGVSAFSLDPLVLQDLKDEILLTPNGVMYTPSKVRKGIMPRLLEEILSTRIMVKQAMKKLAPSQQVLHRIFNARQLALKLIANVTYGYTAAGFSGRMPCAELADSIVQCGRCTLERAVALVNANDNWKARVIYGDTDSMFVLLKGRSIKESFQIGREIASAVTAMNPDPVTLKLEKVYHPCFLLTKKRYVGYSYENADQTEPTFDAKGIETVRRDTCGAVAKIMEQSLRLFFEHQDVSEVKSYLQRQWQRILSGRVSLQDFVFAKEVRLGTYSTRASSLLPPAAIVATKAMKADPRAEPCYAERVPYVVIHGEPGARLVDMVVDPLDLLAIDSPYRLNERYYITKQIVPALQRVFGLVGADLNLWFLEMPRPARETIAKHFSYAPNPLRTRIDYYYLSKHCVLCGELVHTSAHLCHDCSQNEIAAATAITGRTSKFESHIQHLAAICRHCGGGDWLVECGVKCTSLACSVFYERRKVQKELRSLSAVAAAKGFYPKCMVELF